MADLCRAEFTDYGVITAIISRVIAILVGLTAGYRADGLTKC